MMKDEGAQFEILVDGKTRSYRDSREIALEAISEGSESECGSGCPRYPDQYFDDGGVEAGEVRFG
jgi:hypothetical protein